MEGMEEVVEVEEERYILIITTHIIWDMQVRTEFRTKLAREVMLDMEVVVERHLGRKQQQVEMVEMVEIPAQLV